MMKRMNGSIRAVMRHQARREWCPYCGLALQPHNSSIDHILPQSSDGGLSVWYNEAGTCRNCNHRKADRTLLGFLMIRGLPKAEARLIPQPKAVYVLPLDELSKLPQDWQDPLATLGYERSAPKIQSIYRGLGAKERKVLRAKLAAEANS